MKTEDLKPCPFCGGNDISFLPPNCKDSDPYRATDHLYPILRCRGCFTEVAGKDYDRSGKSVRKLWNTRPTDRAAVVEECAQVVDRHGANWKFAFAGAPLAECAADIRALAHTPQATVTGEVEGE